MITQNHLPNYVTVVANNCNYGERPCGPGEFLLKMNRTLPLDQFGAVTCNQVTIENAILNYDSNRHFVEGKKNYIEGQLHIDEIDEFIIAVLGPSQSILSYDDQKNKMLLHIEQSEKFRLSAELAKILGFENSDFNGPTLVYSDRAPDIYRNFRPMYLMADFCDQSTFTPNRMVKLLCTINTDTLDPVSNKTTNICASFGSPAIWRRTATGIPIYSQLILRDSSFHQVPTLCNCKINIELTFRSNCLYDQI